MRTVRFLTGGLIGAVLIGPGLFGQLKVDVSLVHVVTTVTDDRGRYIADLKADDFIVEEDGQPQKIVHLSQSYDLPVSVGLLLDNSISMERKISTATEAVGRFIRTIHEHDDIFLMTFSDRTELRQDFTDDRSKLAAALRRIPLERGTALYDAIEDGLKHIRQGQHTRKALLLITDGVDQGSETSFEDALLLVRESELLVYSLGISPTGGPINERAPSPTIPPVITGPQRGPTIRLPGGIPLPLPIPRIPGVPGRRAMPVLAAAGQNPRTNPAPVDAVDMTVLDAFAEASGGRAWQVSSQERDLDRIFDSIADELRNQYNIGYYPPHTFDDGKWHRIQVRMKNPRYHARARKEYFGK